MDLAGILAKRHIFCPEWEDESRLNENIIAGEIDRQILRRFEAKCSHSMVNGINYRKNERNVGRRHQRSQRITEFVIIFT